MNIEEISNSYEIMNNALFKKKYNNDQSKEWVEWWNSGFKRDKQLYILKDNNDIIISYGLITLTDQLLNENGCLISYIYTISSNRNKGYAKKLINYLKSNFDSIVLLPLDGLENFYKKLNFNPKIIYPIPIEQYIWNKEGVEF